MKRKYGLSVLERLERIKHINTDTGCWEATVGLKQSGYAELRVLGRKVAAHRLSYMEYVGPIPPGMFICHVCDNRKCFNPSHLFLGTQTDNMQDAAAKGRVIHKGPVKILPAMRKLIVADQRTQVEIAKEFGITQGRVSAIQREGDVFRGQGSYMRKVTNEMINAILIDSRTQTEIAKAFGLSQPTISRICLQHGTRRR